MAPGFAKKIRSKGFCNFVVSIGPCLLKPPWLQFPFVNHGPAQVSRTSAAEVSGANL